ncbi:MAG: ABC transporter ATP-binding protein [Solirubrobacterales bacterium]
MLSVDQPQSIAADALPAVLVDGVTKHFSLPADRVQTLKERALHPIRSRERNSFTALDDVAFHVEKGEFFGLVGRNGSGKSTLLKCIAGIYSADSGEIYHDGTLTSFIELGVGFNPELPAFDNVLLNATLLGLDTEAARLSFEEVMDFAELWEFENLKLKNYSSGMYVRLAFSVMLQVDADILLIDEVLAVGDAAFQQKCFDQFNRMRDEGKTIVFVTHGMDAVRRFCDRAVLLDRGRLVAIGDAEEISERYLELNFVAPDSDAMTFDSAVGKATLSDCWVADSSGQRVESMTQGGRLAVHAEVTFEQPVANPWIDIQVRDENDRLLMVSSTQPTEYGPGPAPSGDFETGETAHYVAQFDCVFAAGHYSVSISAGPDSSYSRYFRRTDAINFDVEGSAVSGASVVLPTDWHVEKSVPTANAGETQ